MFGLVAFPVMLVHFILGETLHRLRQRVSFLDDNPLVLTTFEEGEDYGGHQYETRLDVDEFMSTVTSDDYYNPDSRRYKASRAIIELDSIKTVADVKAFISDSYDDAIGVHVVEIETPEEHRERKVTEDRERLESVAANFCQRHQVKMDSLDFITAVVKEVKRIRTARDRWNDPETRQEEWMDRQFVGGGSEAYFDDLNFENSRFDERNGTLEDVLGWIKGSCPLMYTQWKERRAARKKNK